MCWSLVNPRTGDPVLDGPCWLRVWHGGGTAEAAGLASELAAAVALTDLDQVAAETTEIRLLEPLAESIAAAIYWGGQDAVDQALAAPEVAAALMPVAQALGAATAGRVLRVGDARTMLAGWDPDQTWWLSDVLSGNGTAERWVTQSDEPLGWHPGPESDK